MPVSTFDTLPLELQERSKAAERQRVKCELLRRERDARAATERGALNNDWVGISGQRLGDVAEQARRFVLEQAPPRDEPPSSPDPAAVRGEVSVQHEQTRKVFALRQAKGLKYLDEKEPHCRVITRAVVARASAEELAEMVRKRLERLGVQVPKHLRPSTLQDERALHKLVHFCRGNELVDKEHWTAAIAEYDVSLNITPDDVFALINRGNCHKALCSWQPAMADYSAAIAGVRPVMDKQAQLLLAYCHNNLGALHHDLHDFVSAFAEYTSALAFNPSCHIAWKNRANVHYLTAEPSPDPQQPPPRHKLLFSDCLTAMDQDWHEEKGFFRGEVGLTVEVRRIHNTYAAYMVVDLVRLPSRR